MAASVLCYNWFISVCSVVWREEGEILVRGEEVEDDAATRDEEEGRSAGYFARDGLEAVFFPSIDVFQPSGELSTRSTLSPVFSPLHLPADEDLLYLLLGVRRLVEE